MFGRFEAAIEIMGIFHCLTASNLFNRMIPSCSCMIVSGSKILTISNDTPVMLFSSSSVCIDLANDLTHFEIEEL